jgi:glycine cleavage system transcriptional repressor
MRHLALSAIGRDHPGIVAGLTGALLDHEVNIEDSQATILRGHFTIMLILAAPEHADTERLTADLERAARDIGLEGLSIQDVDEAHAATPEPSHTVTVYGIDHPGIVHRVASTLVDLGANITDLNTRLVDEDAEEPLYVLMVEVAFHGGAALADVRPALDELGRSEGVEVSLRELERDAL